MDEVVNSNPETSSMALTIYNWVDTYTTGSTAGYVGLGVLQKLPAVVGMAVLSTVTIWAQGFVTPDGPSKSSQSES